MINVLHLFCNHEWEKQSLLEEYFDVSGYKVGIFRCQCQKCKKIRNRKYY